MLDRDRPDEDVTRAARLTAAAAFRRLITWAIGVAGLLGIGFVVETKADGGFIKDVWEGLKVPSPAISMALAFALYVVWQQWQKDRKEHAERTFTFTETLNKYARILERAGTRRRSRS